MLAQKLLEAAGNATQPNYIEDVFSTYLYTGNGSTQTITNGIDLAGKGGMVWGKGRSVAYSHQLYDTNRGAGYRLLSNTTDAQAYSASLFLTAFNSDGFSLGSGQALNESAATYASWTFRKQPKFFDVVTWTGDGVAGRAISHNLGSTPGFIIVKATNNGSDWFCYHTSLGATERILLNTTGASGTDINAWNNTAPTSTVFTLGAGTDVNYTGITYVAYLFAHNAGGFGLTGTDNVISCGSFTTDATTGAATVNLGWEPQWILTKMSNGLSNWTLFDNMRGMSLTNSQELSANASSGESSPGSADIFPSATGFSVDYLSGSGQFGKNKNIIYIAIRRGPMKVPTDATKVFNTVTATGGPPVFTPSFVTDMAWTRVKNSTTTGFRWVSRLLSGTYADSSSTAAEAALAQYSFDYQNGWRNATVTESTLLSWSFQRAPSFFDEVCYTGTGSARTLSHNLQAVPELILLKDRNNTTGWAWYYGITNKWISMPGGSAPFTSSTIWNDTAPTSSVFSVGADSKSNASGTTYVAYLWASLAGVSKIGTYVGNGSSQTINCGFTSGARFVLITNLTDGGRWNVFDTARGINSASDPVLRLDTTTAEITGEDPIDPDSSGFIVNVGGPDYTFINNSGKTYLYLAIA